MASRICILLTCFIAFAGCYTQLRAPRVHNEQRAVFPSTPSEDAVQRFEYYHSHYNPSPFYEPYHPYRRYPSWNRHHLTWEYSCWASVYDRRWRGWSPRRLVPHIVYEVPAVRPRPRAEPELVNPRPRIRYRGVRGEPASASAIRSGSTTTKSTPKTPRTENARNTKTERTRRTENARRAKTESAKRTENASSSTKTKSSEKPKKEEKSEKREEKRSTKRRRGGMR